MRLVTLHLRDFRNYREQTLGFSEGVTIFTGNNGQGKTNLLEGVALLCTGRSHRTARDREMIREGAETARARMETLHRDGPHSADLLLSRSEKKRILVNGLPASRIGQLVGQTKCVLFSPEDLQLCKSGPASRRRFLDMFLCQARPAYFHALTQYNRTLEHRNRLLKRPVGDFAATLDVFDLLLSKNARQVSAARERLLERLSPLVKEKYAQLAADGPLELSYCPGGSSNEEEALRRLQEGRAQDIRLGCTQFGPHRDDLSLCLNGRDLRAYGSQGQQRTAALALKLSELALWRDFLEEYPLLLLDDVLSELDEDRQERLLHFTAGCQALITAAHITPRLTALHAQIRRVRAGAVLEEE